MLDWKDTSNHNPNSLEPWLMVVVILGMGYVLFQVLRSL